MSNLDKATQENSALAEETASTSEELNAQATSLNQLVDSLVVLVDGNSSLGLVNDLHGTVSAKEPNTEHHHHISLATKKGLRLVKDTVSRKRETHPKTSTAHTPPAVKKTVGSDIDTPTDIETDDGWDKL